METLFRYLSLLLLLAAVPFTTALKFDIEAHPGHESARYERCIRNFVAKDQLVVVTAIVSGSRGDGQMLNMHVSRPSHRTRRPKDMAVYRALAN
jgi:hypothetical protein